MKIIDCFIFFNELDLLEFRLKLLDKYIDHFVIAESNLTHSGKSKPYHFQENKDRFAQWLNKITYIPIIQSIEGLDFSKEVHSYNPASAAFLMENAHRNALAVAATLATDTDLVLMSDLDEIPDPEILSRVNVHIGPQVLSMRFHYYFFNCRNRSNEKWWNGTIVCNGKQFRETTPQELRDKRNVLKRIPDAGWHFSFLGGIAKIREKIISFAHTEYSKDRYLDEKNIEKAIQEGKDIFDRPGIYFEFVSLNDYPLYLREIMLLYPLFIFVPDKDHPNTSKDHPMVSIALCTYNGELYLREQLDSLISQTYPNIEILVSDDASGDNTLAILREYAQKHSQIRIVENEVNIGYNKNFEKAISLCSGPIIATSDQDDRWEAGKIETMMDQWPTGAQFVYSLSGSFTGKDFGNRKPPPVTLYTSINDAHKLVFNSPVHGHACLFTKAFSLQCMPFPENVFYDWWMSMHAAVRGTIGCIPQVLTWHRVHEDNSSRNITSIKDKKERERQLREQCAFFIESFYEKNTNEIPQRQSLLVYARLLKEMNGKKFSWPMFRYVFKNRKLVFHYKRPKPFILISHLKHAYRMAYKGIL